MKYAKRLGLGLLFTLVVLASFGVHDLWAQPSGSPLLDSVNPAYKSGDTFKYKNVIYTFKAIDDRPYPDSTITGWSIYLPAGWTCGDNLLADNPDSTGTIAFRSSAPIPQNVPSPAIGDCATQKVDPSLPGVVDIFDETTAAIVEVNTSALCAEAGGDWANNFCTFNNTPSQPASIPPGGAEDRTCEGEGAVMSWVLCPMVTLLDGVLDLVDRQVEALLEVDRDKYQHDDLYKAWTTIRNIAYIILIPIMLVMVIGTALGFEIFSAYTIKKALPRMVVAVIFITLSWYICQFLIGFSNVVGAGVNGLITQPFRQNMPESCQQGNLGLACVFDTPGGGGPSGNFLHTLIMLPQYALMFVGVLILIVFFGWTMLLIVGTAMIILLARQMFVIGLLLLAPLAILAWIFPGNDKLWKSWWNIFTKLLLMFPLIMLILAMGKIFAYLINVSDNAGLDGGLLSPIMKLVAYMLPYAFIPFAFKFAGGVFANLAGVINDREKGLFDRAKQSRARKWERGALGGRIGKDNVIGARAEAFRRLNSRASRSGRVGGALQRGLARGIGGYNIEAQMSAQTAASAKELGSMIETGKDDAVRGLAATYAYDMGFEKARAAGFARIGEGGQRQYRSLGGAWVDEANVLEGRRRWGRDSFAQQAALSYEMKKAIREEDINNIRENYGLQAQSWGMSDNEAFGAWVGGGFENQNQHLEFKHSKYVAGKNGQPGKVKLNGDKMVQEIYEKRGSYNMAQMNANTIKQIQTSFDTAQRQEADAAQVIATGQISDGAGGVRAATVKELDAMHAQYDAARETQVQIQSVAETFMSRFGAGTEIMQDGDEVRATPAAGGTNRPSFQTNTPGAGHVAEAVRDLAQHVGVYRDRPMHTSSR